MYYLPPFHAVSKAFVETELESLNEKIFPFSLRITLSAFTVSIFNPAA
jgi:hypothetical protein